jgi:hypothetical protein
MQQLFQGTFLALHKLFQRAFLSWRSFSGCSRQHAAAGCRTWNLSAMHYLLLCRLKSTKAPARAAMPDAARLATEAMPDMPPVSGSADVFPCRQQRHDAAAVFETRI